MYRYTYYNVYQALFDMSKTSYIYKRREYLLLAKALFET
jgi:hypothetical protein